MKPVPIKRKRPICTATRVDGERCTNYALTQEGITSLLARGVGLVAAPEGLCPYHARSEASRRQFQSQGGVESAKRFHAPKVEPEPDPMPVDVTLDAYRLIRGLIGARIPDTFPAEPDWRRNAVGVYLAAMLCAQPDDRMVFAHSLLRDVHARDDTFDVAEDELRRTIEELDHEQRNAAWELLATA